MSTSEATNGPTVSVLIVNWNTRDLLDACLDSLRRAEPAAFLETIVVDNGSTDGSLEMLHRAADEIDLVANERNVGFTRATNQAFERSTAPYLLMLNSDTVVPEGTISGCVQQLKARPDVAVIGCALKNPDGTDQNSVFRFPGLWGTAMTVLYLAQLFPDSPVFNRERYGRGRWDEPHVVDVVMGSFLLVRRDALPPGPLLDEGYFMYGEETDLCRRLAEKGHRVLFDPEHQIVHEHGGSAKSPELVAWAEVTKRRANLRIMRRWRPPVVAWLANLMMLVGLGPRSIAWLLGDAVDRLRRRSDTGRRLRLFTAAPFHVRALTHPTTMDQRWGPPPAPAETEVRQP
jgi:GT2 family glycosyltransferase